MGIHQAKKKASSTKKCTIEILEWFESLLRNRGKISQQQREDWIFFVLHRVFLCFVKDPISILKNWSEDKLKYRPPTKDVQQLSKILSSYEFVLKEHSEGAIGPDILGVLFENVLGFLEQKQTNIRHKTGSFYTPPQIVNYMIEESLSLYLERKISMKSDMKEKLHQLLRCSTLSSKNPLKEDLELSKKIIQVLSKCRILDPCCGAGSFSVGVLERMVNILDILDPKNVLWKEIHVQKYRHDIENLEIIFDQNRVSSRFAKKLFVIKNCIFGVDIQPLATQICAWRCLISLISEIKKDTSKQSQQNLNFLRGISMKFISANALLDCGLQEQGNKSDLQVQIQEIFQRIFFVSWENTKFLDKHCQDYQRVVEKNYEGNPFLKKYERMDTALCFDPLLMFGIDFFDIVITNPPYIGQKNNNHIFEPIKKSSLGRFHQRRMDYFYFFFHKAIDLVCHQGVISFITTNYYITATYADKLRRDMKERTSIRQMLNFDRLKIFASAAGQHNLITILSKNISDSPIKIIHTQRQGMASPKVLHEILYGMDSETLYFERSQHIYETENNYIFLQPRGKDDHISKILDMMQNSSTRLKDVCDITQGIVTGADKLTDTHLKKYEIAGRKGEGIFVLSVEEISNLNFLETDELPKPWFKNSDISRWVVHTEPKNFLLYSRMSHQQKFSLKVQEHFERYKPILINRNTKSGTGIVTEKDYQEFLKGNHSIDYVMLASAQRKGRYDCVSYARNPRFFESKIPKIVVPQRSSKNTFGYTEVCFYASADVYFLISKKGVEIELKYILALLNSKLYYVWLYRRGKRKGKNLELYQRPLEDIPIFLEVDKETQKLFVEVVDTILQNRKNNEDCSDLEECINKMVYELYELTDEQITAIEGFMKS